MGHRKTRRFRCFIMAAGIGTWLLAGGARTLAQPGCGVVCQITDCNLNWIPDSCDVSCSNLGPFCVFNTCPNSPCDNYPLCGLSCDCNFNGIPDECEPDSDGNGLPDDCLIFGACCVGDSCSNTIPSCCAAQGGTFRGLLTSCSSIVACCFSNSCEDLDPECCLDQGGVPTGNGSLCASDVCTDAFACCNADHVDTDDKWCDNHRIFDCVGQGGSFDQNGLCEDLDQSGDNDGVADSCDNCPGVENAGQEDTDACVGGTNNGLECVDDADCPGGVCTGDGVGDVCDNCEDHINPNQRDTDECVGGTNDGLACVFNADCGGGVCTGDGVGDVCDNCPDDINPNQEDCDGDGTGDACEADCDGDGIPDDCDPDIDDDGIPNPDDVCDFTPLTLTVDTSGLFIGTVRADLDGDCDVDSFDLDLLTDLLGDSTCDPFNGASSEELLCVQTICDPCNSCCFAFPR